MKAFRKVTSHAVALDRPDVDTDQIIPKQFLKRIAVSYTHLTLPTNREV